MLVDETVDGISSVLVSDERMNRMIRRIRVEDDVAESVASVERRNFGGKFEFVNEAFVSSNVDRYLERGQKSIVSWYQAA